MPEPDAQIFDTVTDQHIYYSSKTFHENEPSFYYHSDERNPRNNTGTNRNIIAIVISVDRFFFFLKTRIRETNNNLLFGSRYSGTIVILFMILSSTSPPRPRCNNGTALWLLGKEATGAR